MASFARRHLYHLTGLLLTAVTFAAFCQMLGHQFLNYDDGVYVTANHHVRAGLTWDGVVWALTSVHAANWHPLTWVSHMVDASVYGMDPAGHHLTSLLFHVANVLLLFLILLRLTAHPSDNSTIRDPKSQIRHPIAPSPTPPLSPSSVWKSAFVAVLFAVHPLHVESVAWVAERKDVLSTFFFLLTILAYVRYVEKPGVARYTPVVVLFALGLMAKPMLVTLPFVLLLLDYWPLGRLKPSAVSPDVPSPRPSPVAASRTGEGVVGGSRVAASRTGEGVVGGSRVAASRTGEGVGGSLRTPETRNPKPVTRKANTQHPTPNTDPPLCPPCLRGSISRLGTTKRLLLEKVPLLLLVLGSSLVTFVAQRGEGAIGAFDQLPLITRIANALVSYVAYIAKMVWPTGLSVFYPHPGDALPVWQVVLSGILLAGITWMVIRLARAHRYLAVGWFWYIGTLVPVIGLVQIGSQSMADRYTYVPLIGLFVMIAWGIPDLMKGRKGEWEKGGRNDAGTRRRGDTANPQARTPDTEHRTPNTLSLLLLALVIIATLAATTARQVGYWRNTITLFEHALMVTNGNYVAHNSLGSALEAEGDLDGAAEHFLQALAIRPRYAEAHYHLGVVLQKQGRVTEAIDEYHTALDIRPNIPEAYNNLGVACLRQGRFDEAIDCYWSALKINSEYPDAYKNLAVAFFYKGDYEEAWRDIHICRRLGGQPNPRFLQALAQAMPEPPE